ncbi:MAG: hypothetical protein AAF801_04295 [Pseudomonadota bacterium]
MDHIRITCRCGRSAMVVSGPPIMAAECHCASCRKAAKIMEALPQGVSELVQTGGTQFVLMRKDRVAFDDGAEHLHHFRLKPDSKTRRVIATCCNSPMFLEFADGHWLSVYAARWSAEMRPKMDLRTMTKDRVDKTPLPPDMPNPKSHNARFMLKLLGAWVAMRFRVPMVRVGQERIVFDV